MCIHCSTTAITGNELYLDPGTADVTCNCTFTVNGDICLFCYKFATKVIYFKSGQKLNLCEDHLNEIKSSIGDNIKIIEKWYPYPDMTPTPSTDIPFWTNVLEMG